MLIRNSLFSGVLKIRGSNCKLTVTFIYGVPYMLHGIMRGSEATGSDFYILDCKGSYELVGRPASEILEEVLSKCSVKMPEVDVTLVDLEKMFRSLSDEKFSGVVAIDGRYASIVSGGPNLAVNLEEGLATPDFDPVRFFKGVKGKVVAYEYTRKLIGRVVCKVAPSKPKGPLFDFEEWIGY